MIIYINELINQCVGQMMYKTFFFRIKNKFIPILPATNNMAATDTQRHPKTVFKNTKENIISKPVIIIVNKPRRQGIIPEDWMKVSCHHCIKKSIQRTTQ